MLKAIIFDMDGVIADSEPANIEANDRVLRYCNIQAPEHYFEQFFGNTHEHLWNHIRNEFHLPLSTEECIKMYKDYLAEILKEEKLRPIPGVIDLIKHFHEEGFVLAVASSNLPEIIKSNIEKLGLSPYFTALVSGKNCKRGKPFPDVFLKAAEELHCAPEECLVIEDSTNGVLAAKAAGMACIGFANPAFASQNIHEADYIVSDFKDVTGKLCRDLAATA